MLSQKERTAGFTYQHCHNTRPTEQRDLEPLIGGSRPRNLLLLIQLLYPLDYSIFERVT